MICFSCDLLCSRLLCHPFGNTSPPLHTHTHTPLRPGRPQGSPTPTPGSSRALTCRRGFPTVLCQTHRPKPLILLIRRSEESCVFLNKVTRAPRPRWPAAVFKDTDRRGRRRVLAPRGPVGIRGQRRVSRSGTPCPWGGVGAGGPSVPQDGPP